MALTSAIEPLRMANKLANKKIYEWFTINSTEATVKSSSDIAFHCDYALNNVPKLDILLVCSGENIQRNITTPVANFLKTQSHKPVILGSLCTGSYILAKAKLLDGYRCTVHWESIASLRDEFPEIIVSSELFEFDRNRYTCSGGTAPLDMMINLIKQQHGARLATDISDMFMVDRIRGKHDKQRIPLKQHLGSIQPKLVEAVTLMESNIEEPMSLDELAYHVGLSRRQLERLFQKYLQCVPTRYYMELRLRRARELLLQTSKSVVDIAFACGFISAPHFSKCYRDFFGVAPRDERKNNLC